MKTGQSPNYWTNEEVLMAQSLREQGLSYRQIGVQLGRDGSCVRKRINQAAQEQSRASCKDWYKKNAEHKKAKSKERYKAHSQSMRSQSRLWRTSNPDKRKAQRLRRRARAAAIYTLIPVDSKVILQRLSLTSGMCCWCSSEKATTIDHFLPLSKGGTHVPSNLLPACNQCNGRKQASDPFEWFSAQPFYSEERWQLILSLVGKSQRGRNPVHYGQISFL
jgi:5-methylcytosine-specific restriction endonuclease McrA